MPTFRQDNKLGDSVPLIKTPDIGDKQVTERKLADGSVTSSKLSTEIANMLSLLTTRISAFKVADNLSSLPTEENTIGWLVDNHLYVYVGNGSTPESGMYQDCGELRGPQGIQGEQGLSGLNGKSAYDIWAEQPGNEDKSEIDFLEFTRGSKGDKGDQGERGYDISNIEQIVKSTEDGGKNIIRVTRSDGWNKVFEILNGSKGSKGDKGTSIVKLEQTRKTTESSGLNTIEATLGDGTKESFEIYNGAKGEQGDKGEKGDKGDQGEIGPQGNSGIADASNKTLVNDAVTGGETDFLSAEVGKLGILTYDCSKGGSVTHATLQDAINSVPTTFQKVGLTITYKSGNTIYQYTLKANTWSADPENWFSVMDKTFIVQEAGKAEDKVMSQKATTTAITDETTRAKAALALEINGGLSYGFVEQSIELVNGKFIFNDGTIASNANFCYSKPIALHEGDVIKVVTEDGKSSWDSYFQLAKVITDDVSYSKVIEKANVADPIAIEYTIQEDGNYAVCGMIGYTKLYKQDKESVVYGAKEARGTSYDNSLSEINADNVQDAIDTTVKHIKGDKGFVEQSIELVNGKFIFNDGTIASNANFCYSKPIALHEGDVIKVVTEDGKSSWDSYFQLAKVITDDVSYSKVIEKANVADPIAIEYTIQEDGNYAVCGMIGYTKLYKQDKESVVYGAKEARGTSYDNSSSGINANNVQDAIDIVSANKGRRYSHCKFYGEQPAANGSDFAFNPNTQGYNELIDNIYEPLRLANPKYITRTNIGKDASGTIDMYVYEFIPRYYQQHILLVSGVHGNEVDGVICLARIMQLVTNNSGDDEDYEFIRNNVRVTVVPCLNVWGISMHPNVRTNYDGLEMQSWNDVREPKEVTNLIAYLNGVYKTISFGLSMHTTVTDVYKDFYGVIKVHEPNVRTIYRVDDWLCRKYAKNGATVDDQVLGYFHWKNGDQMEIDYWKNHYGFASSIMELSDLRWGALHSAEAITMGVTMWLNFIVQQINDFYTPQSPIIDIPDEDYRESAE